MAMQECPKCGSLREILDFCKPAERLEPCGYCRDPETTPRNAKAALESVQKLVTTDPTPTRPRFTPRLQISDVASITVKPVEGGLRLGIEFLDEPGDPWEGADGSWINLSDAQVNLLRVTLESELLRGARDVG